MLIMCDTGGFGQWTADTRYLQLNTNLTAFVRYNSTGGDYGEFIVGHLGYLLNNHEVPSTYEAILN